MNPGKIMRKVGWYCFILMWIPFATLMIAMWSKPAGDYSWEALPRLAQASLLMVGLLGGTSMILLVGSPIVSGLRNRRVLHEGLPATAKVLKLVDTGSTINNNPVVRMVLEVRPPGGSPFQAETERLVSRLEIPQIQPGALIRVKYDPESRAVAWDEGADS